LEHVGFWGPPGTPAPDSGAPVGIHPIAIPTLESQEEYETAYPSGENMTYQWFAPEATLGKVFTRMEADLIYLALNCDQIC
jgi:hypothetical protein